MALLREPHITRLSHRERDALLDTRRIDPSGKSRARGMAEARNAVLVIHCSARRAIVREDERKMTRAARDGRVRRRVAQAFNVVVPLSAASVGTYKYRPSGTYDATHTFDEYHTELFIDFLEWTHRRVHLFRPILGSYAPHRLVLPARLIQTTLVHRTETDILGLPNGGTIGSPSLSLARIVNRAVDIQKPTQLRRTSVKLYLKLFMLSRVAAKYVRSGDEPPVSENEILPRRRMGLQAMCGRRVIQYPKDLAPPDIRDIPVNPPTPHNFTHSRTPTTITYRHRAEEFRSFQIVSTIMNTCVSRHAEADPELLRKHSETAQRKVRGPSRGAGGGCRDTPYLRTNTVLRFTLGGASLNRQVPVSRRSPRPVTPLALTGELPFAFSPPEFDDGSVEKCLDKIVDTGAPLLVQSSATPAVLLAQRKSARTHPFHQDMQRRERHGRRRTSSPPRSSDMSSTGTCKWPVWRKEIDHVGFDRGYHYGILLVQRKPIEYLAQENGVKGRDGLGRIWCHGRPSMIPWKHLRLEIHADDV
ncbi:uncharacterized protein C8Q71DRAFT_727404 [Rhodofomes roseus]|uniref:Uncharacterized protein n=1 Tax=Rhodofomes roseus TaxID=34475 RepID=A0ABQ8K1X5_9APHY|nr:uncharacterized protein C8Q71DRAFT_727404 [Rhodofomes roseus]KAH9830668.1 hypothetical protein C8Q71DRAFT_727404 [Rhodofomes roseus]